MNTTHSPTHQEIDTTVAELRERDRRAKAYPELVAALKDCLKWLDATTAGSESVHARRARALLSRLEGDK